MFVVAVTPVENDATYGDATLRITTPDPPEPAVPYVLG